MTGAPPDLRVVSRQELEEAVTPADALASAERAFAALADGRATLPPPVGLEIPARQGEVHVKGAWIHDAPIFAFKVASGFYDNAARGLPTGSGMVLVFDAETGFPLALLRDEGWLTELRTGAAGALAARLLTPDIALRVGVVGAGMQARFQLRALAGVREVVEARVWSRTPEEGDAIRRDLEGQVPFQVRPVGSAEEAVREADLVFTVTPSREPLVQEPWVGPGATVVAVGSDGPGKQELSAELILAADRVVTDRTEQSVRLGELQQPVARGRMRPEDVHAELGDLVLGRRSGRDGTHQRIVCDLTGVGVQDAAIAEAAWAAVRP